MILVNELRSGTFFEEDGQIFEVLSYEHTKMGRGSGNVRLRVRNLVNGALFDKTFITGAKVYEVNPEKVRAGYLYSDNKNFYFMDSKTFQQYEVAEKILGEKGKFLKEGWEVWLLVLGGKPLSVEIPKAVDLKVVQTGSNFKGNTVTSVYKPAVLENGLEVKVPVFVKTGDLVRVNTSSGEYIERAKG